MSHEQSKALEHSKEGCDMFIFDALASGIVQSESVLAFLDAVHDDRLADRLLMSFRPESPKGSGQAQVVDNFLAVSHYSLPAGWVREPKQDGIGSSEAQRFHPADESGMPGDQVEIAVLLLSCSEGDVKILTELLSKNPASSKDEVIWKKEYLRKLDRVLGSAGDNQYTNDNPDWKPVFHLTQASTTRLDGRTVLEVRGYFNNSAGNRDKEFLGYYIPSGSNTVQELHYLAPANPTDRFPRHLPEFKQSLQSLRLN